METKSLLSKIDILIIFWAFTSSYLLAYSIIDLIFSGKPSIKAGIVIAVSIFFLILSVSLTRRKDDKKH